MKSRCRFFLRRQPRLYTASMSCHVVKSRCSFFCIDNHDFTRLLCRAISLKVVAVFLHRQPRLYTAFMSCHFVKSRCSFFASTTTTLHGFYVVPCCEKSLQFFLHRQPRLYTASMSCHFVKSRCEYYFIDVHAFHFNPVVTSRAASMLIDYLLPNAAGPIRRSNFLSPLVTKLRVTT